MPDLRDRDSLFPGTIGSRLEPKARGTVFVGLREAAVDVWGEPGAAMLIQALPPDVRRDTVESLVVSVGWYPERYVMAWFEAAYVTMAHRLDHDFHVFIDRMMYRGFGKIRRALLRLASPRFLLEKASELWRHDHSHGTLEASVGAQSAQLRLDDHVYVRDPIACLALSEVFRYGVVMTGTEHVTASHYLLTPQCLIVDLRWRV